MKGFLVLDRLENKNLQDAEKKLEEYKEKFRKKEESGRTIISGFKRINKDFTRKQKPLSYIVKNNNNHNNNNQVNIDRETLYLVSGNEKRTRVCKGLQAFAFIKVNK